MAHKLVAHKEKCQCFSSQGEKEEKFCESNPLTRTIEGCLKHGENNKRCHWGPAELSHCQAEVKAFKKSAAKKHGAKKPTGKKVKAAEKKEKKDKKKEVKAKAKVAKAKTTTTKKAAAKKVTAAKKKVASDKKKVTAAKKKVVAKKTTTAKKTTAVKKTAAKKTTAKKTVAKKTAAKKTATTKKPVKKTSTTTKKTTTTTKKTSTTSTCLRSSESGLRSVKGTTAENIIFKNDSKDTLSCVWLDYSGKEHKYFDLAAGQSKTQPSYETHAWVLKNGSKVVAASQIQEGDHAKYPNGVTMTVSSSMVPSVTGCSVHLKKAATVPKVKTATAAKTSTATALAKITATAAALTADQKCLKTSEAGLRSVKGTQAENIVFKNDSHVSLSAVWLDYSGKEHVYFTLAAGQSKTQPSYETHAWVLKEGSKVVAATQIPEGAHAHSPNGVTMTVNSSLKGAMSGC